MIWRPSNTRTEAALWLFAAVIVLGVAGYWAGRSSSAPIEPCLVRCLGINCFKNFNGDCLKLVGGDSTECKWWWVSRSGCTPSGCTCDTQNVTTTWKQATCTTSCQAIQTNWADGNNNCTNPIGDDFTTICCQRCL